MFVDRKLPMKNLALQLAALASVGTLLLGCGNPPTSLASECIENWPEMPAPFVAAQSITDVEPGILWTEHVANGRPAESLLLSGGKVAFTKGHRLYQVDPADGAIATVASVTRESVTSPVYDEQGNAYFAGYSVYSVAPDGSYRWATEIPKVDDELVRARGRMVRDPDGDVYFIADDRHLYGVSGVDGRILWRQYVAADDEPMPILVGGIGDALMLYSSKAAGRAQLWSRRTGQAIGYFYSTDGERYGAMMGPELGIVTQRMEDRGGSYPWMHISVLDQCSKDRWHLVAERPQWPVLVGPGDHLYVVERDDYPQSPTAVSVYAPNGDRVAGPTEMAIPWAIGADGIIYSVACDSSGIEGPSRLYAYNLDLEEQWMLPLGDSCPLGGPVIDEQGRLFFTWYRDDITEMVAVQTTSPGLAPTSWPIRRVSADGGAWVK